MHQALETTSYDSMAQFLGTSRRHRQDRVHFGSPSVYSSSHPDATPHRAAKVGEFNPWVAPILDSNMDLQMVLDTCECAAYVVEYVNKTNRGMSSLNRVVQETVR
ncbi:hypothetical protein HPB52_015829 [Rhipicephalus sanguineus]|uniref:Uncharacterized protein n=1 Tax=Rhipicephalus sanguineus TaxID=34632 RepID=A0A9D4TAM4_RHISA|nr:hypothetical protein HPB52_015829 [Rhipicephalus sanguineus]